VSDDLDEMGRRLAGLLRRAGRDTADVLAMVDPVPLVHVRCAGCGDVAGTIEGRRASGQLEVRVGRQRYRSLDVLACARHGQLQIATVALAAHLATARTTHRPETYHAEPSSTP
jgi:hypothetical protein